MIIPIVAAVTREAFAATPRLQREAILALGGTRWDVIRQVVIPISRTGLFAAIILGLGRAIGEAVLECDPSLILVALAGSTWADEVEPRMPKY